MWEVYYLADASMAGAFCFAQFGEPAHVEVQCCVMEGRHLVVALHHVKHHHQRLSHASAIHLGSPTLLKIACCTQPVCSTSGQSDSIPILPFKEQVFLLQKIPMRHPHMVPPQHSWRFGTPVTPVKQMCPCFASMKHASWTIEVRPPS